MGKNLSFSDINVQPWWVQVPTGKSLLVPSAKIISSTLNIGQIVKLVYILLKTSRSQSWSGSHVSHEENTRSIQLEIDHLQRRLRRERQRKTPSSSNPSSDDDRDDNYKSRSRNPPSKTFSYDKDQHYKHRSKSPSRKGLVNNAMSEALNQISKSSFTRRIEGGKLPWRFT